MFSDKEAKLFDKFYGRNVGRIFHITFFSFKNTFKKKFNRSTF